jgi:hypothetical protein
LLLLIALDGLLVLLLLRANRPAESLPDEWFGNNNSWTQVFHVLVALALGLLALDLWQATQPPHAERMQTLLEILVPIFAAVCLFRWAYARGWIWLWVAWLLFSAVVVVILARSPNATADWPLWGSALAVGLNALGIALLVPIIQKAPFGAVAQILLGTVLGLGLYFLVIVLLAATVPPLWL